MNTSEENKFKADVKKTTFQNQSVFTLLVYFRKGYTHGMKFHSYKQEKRRYGSYQIRDERYALNRLVALVEDRFKDEYKTAIIYYNPTGEAILTYAYGMEKDKAYFEWQYKDDGDVLFVLKDRPKGYTRHNVANMRV